MVVAIVTIAVVAAVVVGDTSGSSCHRHIGVVVVAVIIIDAGDGSHIVTLVVVIPLSRWW